jgi:hypothetical protein
MLSERGGPGARLTRAATGTENSEEGGEDMLQILTTENDSRQAFVYSISIQRAAHLNLDVFSFLRQRQMSKFRSQIS